VSIHLAPLTNDDAPEGRDVTTVFRRRCGHVLVLENVNGMRPSGRRTMTDPHNQWLAERFQEARPRLIALAFRILGSTAEAEDAVQEAWLRLSRVDGSSILNVGGWLTTVVARVCLDLLRRRKRRNEEELDELALEPVADDGEADPEREALLAESVGQAMLLVLDRLTPAERVAFVLHDMFDLPFSDIAMILERSEESVRQLASRGRRRVQAARGEGRQGPRAKREIVDAFLAASRQGDFSALLRLLDPQVVLSADLVAVKTAASNQPQAPGLALEVVGAEAVANAFKGRARGARLVYVDGEPQAAWIHEGTVRALFMFSADAARITSIRVIMEPAALSAVNVVLPDRA
jgi:RNA polymerase sigma factor (sigma-70 family)